MLRDPAGSQRRWRRAAPPSNSAFLRGRSRPPREGNWPRLLLQFGRNRRWCSAICARTPTKWPARWRSYGFTALALHGDMEQRDRDEVLVRFANRSCNVLVASDVAARGLDIDDIGAVVNYELPTDVDTYLHRSAAPVAPAAMAWR
jgi:hypothetical protein